MRSLFILLLCCPFFTHAQKAQRVEFNKSYPAVAVTDSLQYTLPLDKNIIYNISALQQGIDVVLQLWQNGKLLVEQDSPNGTEGYETFEYEPVKKGVFELRIKTLPGQTQPKQGKIILYIKQYPSTEAARRQAIRAELAPENSKNILTADIDHFWQAFDKLSSAHAFNDSVAILQEVYLDRATDGLKDFIRAREFTATRFVETINRFPKFYRSVRPYTYKAKLAGNSIDSVFSSFRKIYVNFKPFKVCFAIGLVNTGGTVSDKFVLIGTEISAANQYIDLTEFKKSALSERLRADTNVVERLKLMISHECVHTQQKKDLDSNAIQCELLTTSMLEGFCDFIGELVTGSSINKATQAYGDAHEAALWAKFKVEMCGDKVYDWMYNGSSVKDKPADLGYYMGYTIAREYYRNAKDKTQAVTDIIEVTDPVLFLAKSGYERKAKN